VTDVELTLQEAADALGVHYMTAYRYVRLGVLEASKTAGTWKVQRSDVDAFRSGATATIDAPVGGGRRRAPWAERLEARLLAGDGRGAWGVIEASLAAGGELESIYVDVMWPALASIGERWASGEIDVADEHRASGIAMRLIGRLGPRFARRGRTRGQVLLGAPAGEQHFLSLAMLGDLIRQQGWEVSDLGADVPPASFAKAAVGCGDDLVAVGMSASTPQRVPALVEAIAAVRAVVPEVPIMVGGMAVAGDDHARSLGADRYVASARDIGAVMESLPPRQTAVAN
jgi:excisionase family DNA binding protein